MCKSVLYTAMTTGTVVASGGIIPLGSVLRQYGRNCQLYGNSVLLKGSGYYDVKSTITFTPASTTADTYTVQLYKDGVEVPGAVATVTTGVEATLPLTAVLRTQCCAESALSMRITAGTETNTVTINNVSFVAEKL